MKDLSYLPPILTPQQVAEVIYNSASQVYKLTSTGELPSIRIGRSVRILRADLINFIQKHRKSTELPDDEESTNGQ